MRTMKSPAARKPRQGSLFQFVTPAQSNRRAKLSSASMSRQLKREKVELDFSKLEESTDDEIEEASQAAPAVRFHSPTVRPDAANTSFGLRGEIERTTARCSVERSSVELNQNENRCTTHFR